MRKPDRLIAARVPGTLLPRKIQTSSRESDIFIFGFALKNSSKKFGFLGKSNEQTFTSRLSYSSSRTGALNSTPQLLARDSCAVAQGAQLGPGDLRGDAAAQAAVRACDDVFSADEFSEREQSGRVFTFAACRQLRLTAQLGTCLGRLGKRFTSLS
jgi:hypothetical protein